jgi:tetratricopeptide (TPR) repeat protein
MGAHELARTAAYNRSADPQVASPMKTVVTLSVVAALAVLLSGPAAHGQTPDADALFARAVALHKSGDTLGAIENYQAVLEKDPTRIAARSNLGAAFAQLGRYAEAVENYRKALEEKPEQHEVRFNLALAFYKSSRLPEAAAELERVSSEDASNLRAVLLLADCRTQLGQDAGVVELLAPRDQEFKDDRLYAYLLGNALLRRNEILRGQALVDRLFQGGETAEARLLMGVAHLQRGDHRAAVPELERAVALNAALPGAHSLLGRALMGAGRRDESVKAFAAELAASPNDFDANLYLGIMLKDDGKLDEAHEHLKRAQRLRSRDVAVQYALGALHLAAGRTEDARQALEVVTAEAPDYRQGHVLLATAYYRLKDKEKGDREQAAAERLRVAEQSREAGASEDLGSAYHAGVPAPPSSPTPPPPSAPEARR